MERSGCDWRREVLEVGGFFRHRPKSGAGIDINVVRPITLCCIVDGTWESSFTNRNLMWFLKSLFSSYFAAFSRALRHLGLKVYSHQAKSVMKYQIIGHAEIL